MNRQKGLLAFLCAVIAATCAVLQLPVVLWVERMFGGAPPAGNSPFKEEEP